MYNEMCRVTLIVLPETPPWLSQMEIRAAVVTNLSPKLFPSNTKADWWLKLVQVDLEAKSILCSMPFKSLRWHRKPE